MPEGDTLFRTAAGLRPHLLDRKVIAATARQPGPRAGLLVGTTIVSVEARGKNLLIGFDSGLELRSHLGMHGSWHRYRPGEPWRRAPARARIVIEVPGSVAVCFDAPTVELLEVRAEHLHRPLGGLGPDLLRDAFDEIDEAGALGRLRASGRADQTIAEALLDQPRWRGSATSTATRRSSSRAWTRSRSWAHSPTPPCWDSCAARAHSCSRTGSTCAA